MPRPRKGVDTICTLLDLANGKLSVLDQINQPVTLKRIEQAIERHPDLRNLLEPIAEEIRERESLMLSAKAAISTAKSVVRKTVR